MLQAHEQAGSFIQSPAVEVAAELIAEDHAQTRIGQQIGPYQIVSHLGAGGMGDVYLAQDSRLGRQVALKLLPDYFISDQERVRRFEQEARAVGRLNHPNILIVHDIGRHEGAPYIVSELLEGQTLRERLADGALPVPKALEYAMQMAGGLSAAHDKGIVHRDLKPENLFVTRDGRVKIFCAEMYAWCILPNIITSWSERNESASCCMSWDSSIRGTSKPKLELQTGNEQAEA